MYTIRAKPISTNRMRRGRTFLSKEYKEFKEDAVLELLSQKPKKNESKELDVTIIFHCKELYRGDVDNMAKGVLDSCTEAGLWKDDRYIISLTLIKEKAKKDSVTICIV